MPSTTVNATVAESVTGSGDVVWSTPANVLASDGSNALALLSAGSPATEALRVTGLDASAIPSGATIRGIEVLIEARYGNLGSGAKVDWVELVQGGVAIGNRDDTDASLSPGQSVKTYGGENETFGAVIDRATLDDATFGAQFQILRTTGSPSALVDAVTFVLYWTLPRPTGRISIGLGLGL